MARMSTRTARPWQWNARSTWSRDTLPSPCALKQTSRSLYAHFAALQQSMNAMHVRARIDIPTHIVGSVYRTVCGVVAECLLSTPADALWTRPCAVLWARGKLGALRCHQGSAAGGRCVHTAQGASTSNSTRISVAEAIPCRIAVRAGDRVHVPVSLPLWGLIDGDHMHINNRVDVHMYTQAGAVVGAGIAAGKPSSSHSPCAQSNSPHWQFGTIFSTLRWETSSTCTALFGTLVREWGERRNIGWVDSF
jgi:hypothetical protein